MRACWVEHPGPIADHPLKGGIGYRTLRRAVLPKGGRLGIADIQLSDVPPLNFAEELFYG